MGNNDICCFAMSYDNHDLDCKLLKLLREYSAPWSEKTTPAAIHNENFEALKWCVSHGCPLDTSESVIIEKIASQGNIELMKWMRAQGYAYCFSEDGLEFFEYQNIPTKFDIEPEEIYEFLQEQKCPQPQAQAIGI